MRQSSNTSRNSKRSSKKSKKGFKLNNRFSHFNKVKISSKKYSFGYMSSCVRILGLILVFIAIQSFCYWLLYQRANLISNLMEVYILGVETYCVYLSAVSATVATVFYNNSVPGFGGKTTMENYYHYDGLMQSYILDNYTSSLSLNLGNYTEEFRTAFTSVINF